MSDSDAIAYKFVAAALILILLICRIAFKLPTIKQNQDIKSNKSFKNKNIMVLLGSGGHTGEMFRMLKTVGDLHEIGHIDWVVSSQDTKSLEHLKNFTKDYHKDSYNIVTIFRARKVGEGLISSVFSTLKSFTDTLLLLSYVTHKPDILLVNGPGTSVPLVLSLFLFNLFGKANTKIVYIESLARVVDLSVSGKVCYLLADRFIVQWPQLQKKYPKSEYHGILV